MKCCVYFFGWFNTREWERANKRNTNKWNTDEIQWVITTNMLKMLLHHNSFENRKNITFLFFFVQVSRTSCSLTNAHTTLTFYAKGSEQTEILCANIWIMDPHTQSKQHRTAQHWMLMMIRSFFVFLCVCVCDIKISRYTFGR